jgi:hypothetical protein
MTRLALTLAVLSLPLPALAAPAKTPVGPRAPGLTAPGPNVPGMVSAADPRAAAAGVEMLKAGGSAVDAAIAANALKGVVGLLNKPAVSAGMTAASIPSTVSSLKGAPKQPKQPPGTTAHAPTPPKTDAAPGMTATAGLADNPIVKGLNHPLTGAALTGIGIAQMGSQMAANRKAKKQQDGAV